MAVADAANGAATASPGDRSMGGAARIDAFGAALPNVRVGVAALLIRPRPGNHGLPSASDVEFLIGERKGSHGAGTLALPGGHLEAGEGWAQCAARELHEETGIDSPTDAWRCAFVSNDVMEEGRKHYITIFMECDVRLLPGGLLRLPEPRTMEPDKCKGWKWASVDILRKVPGSRMFLPMKHFLEAAADGRWRPLRGVDAVHVEGGHDADPPPKRPRNVSPEPAGQATPKGL